MCDPDKTQRLFPHSVDSVCYHRLHDK